ncbi:MAG: transglycosylase SLT domain-containing protein [Gammaproteobacteria bacterium]|jgi:membrane-bound lytic murein transglycosylase F
MWLDRAFLLIITLFCISTVFAINDYTVDSERWTDEYDRHFRKYSKRYFGPLFNWQWFKAQAIAESGLNANAVSSVGAIGLMQIMPDTFKEINDANPHFAEVNKPRWNIAAGIYYDRLLYTKFPKTPEQDRLYLALASYNAGYGTILNVSRKLQTDALLWTTVKPYLPRETRGYVGRIKRLMGNAG